MENQSHSHNSESNGPVPLSEAIQEFATNFFDTPDFRSAVDEALTQHLELLEEYKQKGTLSPEKEEQFTRISSFITIANEIMQNYQRPESDK